ncbi:MAG: LysM peptidoglycan-binding domain-containing protein [Kiritimatiellae bacterium]|nr:LysM peptidoglycan-binding domain-containing protein [Kiritimatiellia bacterium]
MKKSFVMLAGLVALAPAWAQDANVQEASASTRMAYQDRQALAEVPRLIEQFNLMDEKVDQLGVRLVKVESGSGDSAELRAEIEKLRAEVAELRAAVRRDQDEMRREIVDDLTRRLNDITKQMQQNQAQALAQIQARAEAALQAAEASAKAAREQAEYTKRVASRPPAPAPTPRASGGAAAPAKPAAPAYTGPYYEHVVEAGQTLSFIAKGFETSVQKILDANPGLKANNLRVGQKLIIPAEEAPKKK